MKPANFAAVYACLYPELSEIVRKHGYTLAIHGSMARDFDLVAIPWEETVSEPLTVLDEITGRFSLSLVSREPKIKNHGRMAWGMIIQFGDCFIDFSFMPYKEVEVKPESTTEESSNTYYSSFS